ncbi:hypothetical protein [Prauserella muralis]|uniref:Uncharacterized protein n=1 Tax=Prauserella muralis TaxID=588067 RepID=A0A2V4B0A5_9PSEU|nr:hypothetical protein [Prauserella muralis]PXY27437.1 hypothetical protein BAY60_13465 [Prauserella muralis]TWE22862.1 hypothetical protein FHX69_4118 [Prauserella muralis]
MGFTPKRTVLKLSFSESDYDGFEVRIRKMTVEDAYLFDDLTGWEKDIKAGHVSREQAQERIDRMHRRMIECILDWNLEDDDGQPMPVTVESIRAQEPEFFWVLVRAWIRANSIVVDGDLKDSSPSGDPSAEASIPMEELSESLAS